MKNIYYLPVLIGLLSFGSCKKYLETTPTDFLDPNAYYETEAQLEFARAGVYHNVGAPQLWGSWANYLLGWQGDEGYMNRFTLTTGPWNYFYSSADSYNAGYWSNLYNGINRANVVLANLDKNPAISKAKRDAIRGEVIFLRGYFYFQLVQYYGGVPIKTTPTSSVVDVDIPRASLKDTYTQIISDMEAAEPLVPGIASLGYGGAISKSAVRGMLARVNLYMAGAPLNDKTRYTEASKWAKMVIDDTEAAHALNPSYPQIFINLCSDKYDAKESIWEAEFWGNSSVQNSDFSNIGYINGPTSAATTINGDGVAYLSITSKFYDVFEPGDNRKWWSITHFSYTATGKNMGNLPATQAAKNTIRPAKWRREFEVVQKIGANTPNNAPILRYTDILLMYAEAQNEINNGATAEAINYVNLVRKRAWSTGVRTITVTNGGSGYTTAPTVTFSAGNGGATATGVATISGGKVTAITLNRDLTGTVFNVEGKYSTPPTITISGGGGTGATATATIYSLTDAELKPAQTASKTAFLAAIQDERFREFNYEGLRKADLLRWGIFLQVNQDVGNLLSNEIPGDQAVKYFTNVSAKDLFMPIPTSETTTNLAITQNPGWN